MWVYNSNVLWAHFEIAWGFQNGTVVYCGDKTVKLGEPILE